MAIKSASSVKKALLYSFLSICIIGLLGFGVSKTNQLNNTQQVLASTQNELVSTQSDLAVTQANLAITEIELSQTQSELANTEAELSQTQSKLATTQADLSDTQNELNTTTEKLEDTTSQLVKTRADYTTTSDALKTAQAFSASLKSSFDNLQANYNSLTTGYGYVQKDPTYQEMKNFLAADITDSFTYTTNEFVCHDFAAIVTGNAGKQKIRCAYVLIDFIDDKTPGHAIIAFNTTDRGMKYIEPQSDEEVTLRVGSHYWASVIVQGGGHYQTPTYDDTVEDIFCLW